MNFESFLSFLNPKALGLTWLDVIILIVFLFYAYEGYVIGFINAMLDLASFVISFVLALKLYGFVALLIFSNFSITQGFANVLGFFIVAFVSEIIINILFKKMLRPFFNKAFIPSNTNNSFSSRLNKFLGIIPSVLSSAILLSFLFSIIISLPFSPFLKHSVSASVIGNMLVSQTQGFEKSLNNVFGGAIHDTLNFLTVKPESNETVNLRFKTTDVTVDESSEEKMLAMVNSEREKEGVPLLVMDEKLRLLARDYSKDMFARGYFSHYNPEGASPFDRMSLRDISFQNAGENLALAPNVDLAMDGLMRSPGHKANILSSKFGKVGIGVIDGGIYGQMFTQEFTD